MLNISRRSFIAGAAAIPFYPWFERYARADVPLVRYDLTSLEGQAMIRIYADTVAKMTDATRTPPGDATSWIFQWYTHWVKGAMSLGPKAAEIQNIYGSAPSPKRKLAEDMWDTCQAHGADEDEDYFLPWHRMFVYFFEKIVRAASGHAEFTLPYWKYTGPDTNAVLPLPFRQHDSSLFRPDRKSSVNAGDPIDKNRPGLLNSFLSDALAQAQYGQNDPETGFCMGLDNGLHGSVHVNVGNALGMGAVPWAANDPIFWMHHCNLDRIWASWNRNGGKNLAQAAWLSQQFTFADSVGNPVIATVKDFTDIAQLGYTYDGFESAPPNFRPLSEMFLPERFTRIGTASAGVVALGAKPVRVPLTPVVTHAGPEFFAAQVKALGEQKRLYLVLSDLQAEAQPGVLYDVYFDLPETASPGSEDAFRVGTVNFFNAVGHASHAGAATSKSRFFSLDATMVARNLRGKGLLSAAPVVTIAPADRPFEEAKPLIRKISLLGQS